VSAYVPPLADIRFVLGELVGLERVSALPPHAELNDGLVDAVLDEAAKFATGILDPLYRAGDREGARVERTELTFVSMNPKKEGKAYTYDGAKADDLKIFKKGADYPARVLGSKVLGFIKGKD